MTAISIDKVLAKGIWDENITWELYRTTTLPPTELCTAAMCVALTDGGVVLSCSKRGWGVLGGHIEPGENLEQALRREAKEEGGFIVDRCMPFAVMRVTAKTRTRHPESGKKYPFPTSYMVYYLATTKQPLEAPSGDEILQADCFKIDNLDRLNSLDQLVVEAGVAAYLAHNSSSNNL